MRLYSGNIIRTESGFALVLSVHHLKHSLVKLISYDLNNGIPEHARIYSEVIDNVDPKTVVYHSELMKRNEVTFNEKTYTWYELNPKSFSMKDFKINAELSQLDERFQLFMDTASDIQKEFFSKNEDRNQHSENDHFIRLYCEFFKTNPENKSRAES